MMRIAFSFHGATKFSNDLRSQNYHGYRSPRLLRRFRVVSDVCLRLRSGIAALLCWTAAGCTSVARYPLPSDPVPQFEPSELAAWVNAEAYAIENGGDVYRATSGSMVPTLLVGDYVVIEEKPWPDFVAPKIARYQADWLPANADTVLHRIVGRDSGGLIMSGDSNPFSESRWRVTEAKAKGILTGIWRVQK